MTRKEVRAFLKSGVDALDIAVPFNSGLLTFFNSDRKNTYPTVFFPINNMGAEPDPATRTPLDSWQIQLRIGDLDKVDSIPEQYEEIIDRMDVIAQKLKVKYDSIVFGYDTVTIENISREPFVKQHADCVSGVDLIFDLIVPDITNNC